MNNDNNSNSKYNLLGLAKEPHCSSIGLSSRSNNDRTKLLLIVLVNYKLFSNFVAIPFLWDFCFIHVYVKEYHAIIAKNNNNKRENSKLLVTICYAA